MERRVFIAVILSFVVLYGYQALFPPPEPTAPAKPATQSAPAAAAPATAASAASPDTPPVSEPAPAAQVAETAPREIVVDTAHARIVLSNVGARLLHWQLKGYTDAKGAMVDLVPSESAGRTAAAVLARGAGRRGDQAAAVGHLSRFR